MDEGRDRGLMKFEVGGEAVEVENEGLEVEGGGLRRKDNVGGLL